MYLPTHLVVQEYERAVIFRMGRLRSGGARGKFFYDCSLYLYYSANVGFFQALVYFLCFLAWIIIAK
jgi:hypothetical protein